MIAFVFYIFCDCKTNNLTVEDVAFNRLATLGQDGDDPYTASLMIDGRYDTFVELPENPHRYFRLKFHVERYVSRIVIFAAEGSTNIFGGFRIHIIL